MKFTPSQLGFF